MYIKLSTHSGQIRQLITSKYSLIFYLPKVVDNIKVTFHKKLIIGVHMYVHVGMYILAVGSSCTGTEPHDTLT
jgi:hypothetical protein